MREGRWKRVDLVANRIIDVLYSASVRYLSREKAIPISLPSASPILHGEVAAARTRGGVVRRRTLQTAQCYRRRDQRMVHFLLFFFLILFPTVPSLCERTTQRRQHTIPISTARTERKD